jgi:hypothetical protein
VIPSISSSAQQQHHHTAPSSQKVYVHKNAVQSEQINESGDAEHVDAAVDSEDQTGRVEEEPLPPLITAESLISYNLSTPVYDAPKSIRTITETIADIFSLDMKALFPNTTNTNTGATSPEKGNKKSGGRKTSKGGNMLAADAQELLGRFGSKLGSSLEALASRTPVYLLNFVVGTFLVVQANALSGSTFFQYSLVAILGTLLALLWLLFSLYK